MNCSYFYITFDARLKSVEISHLSIFWREYSSYWLIVNIFEKKLLIEHQSHHYSLLHNSFHIDFNRTMSRFQQVPKKSLRLPLSQSSSMTITKNEIWLQPNQTQSNRKRNRSSVLRKKKCVFLEIHLELLTSIHPSIHPLALECYLNA